MSDKPPFNPEQLAPYEATVKADILFRWAMALSGAAGAIGGTSEAFKLRGITVSELDDERDRVLEIQKEIVAVIDASARGAK